MKDESAGNYYVMDILLVYNEMILMGGPKKNLSTLLKESLHEIRIRDKIFVVAGKIPFCVSFIFYSEMQNAGK